MRRNYIAADKEESLVHDEVPLVENVNRLVTEGEEARNVEDAIAVMRYFTIYITLTHCILGNFSCFFVVC